jgi:hypothetical protein
LLLCFLHRGIKEGHISLLPYSETELLAVNSAPSEVLLNKIQYPFPRFNDSDPGTRVYPQILEITFEDLETVY